MKVLITGATGLIGKAIVKKCHEQNITVHYLTTSKEKIEQQDNYKGFYWNPTANKIDVACLDGVESIINLAGATIANRWTASYKNVIVNSRLNTLQLIKETLQNNKHGVKHVISASAIGVYPDSLTNYYDEETSMVSTSFLGEVVEQWEAMTDTFKELDVLVSKVRIGLVLDGEEGALPQIVKPVKFNAGAPFGSGNQWQSWIHINDLAGIFVYVLTQEIDGVINGVAPNPVTNTELTKTVACVLDKKLILPNIPKGFMKLVLGEMHILLFESQRVSSKKIEEAGFQFEYVHLKPALQNLLT
ncbi:TIGR01777 family protein [Bizionia argentinensis JUB59]|uniref:TIGR01777 family protein n=1 Tax=Bizionia argentinensis JUB59 TaxID=1046627 RepID=G2EF25_9FLAO|nr:TIGR01777 family oxidoreductase [Bizionia argentinensis]EGV42972.1 TIGR01777 family protein [Bizionia argentinensis JUB59]